MTRRNTISSLSTLFLGIIFLAGSTGITLIIHSCDVCNKFTVTTGIYLSPDEPEDNCCEAADRHCTPENGTSLESSCCHYNIEKLRLANYSPVFPLTISAPAGRPAVIDLFNNYPVHESIALPHELHNKHGGRHLITCNCQLLS